MQIYPAMDLCNHQCVRLHQGAFTQMTTYSADPIAIAHEYEAAGATWLHLVDLDAARQHGHHHRQWLTHIAQHTSLYIQFGGGVRSAQDIETLLKLGATRVIIGSMAVKNPHLVKEWLHQFGSEHLVIAVDVRCDNVDAPLIAINGWQHNSHLNLWEFLADYRDSGLTHILCTDINRDGTLSGPHLALYQTCRTRFPEYQLQASGGISQLDDITQLREHQLAGAIIGKALYEQRFSLSAALQEAQSC